jgi:hypothetical protein
MKIIVSLILSIFSLHLSAAVSDSEIESFLTLPTGSLDSISTNNATEGSAIKGSYNVNAGDTFSFDFTWDSDEVSGAYYNDFAFYSLSLEDVGVIADTYARDNDTGSFIWTADRSGQLDFGIGIMDLNDSIVSSTLYINNLSSSYGAITGIGDFLSHGNGAFTLSTGTDTNPVPLPASAWLFLTGISFFMYRRKNKSVTRT